MSEEQDERRVYSLSNEHYDWAEVEDLAPDVPELPDELLPLFPTGETVGEVDDLSTYGFDGEAPHFGGSQESVEATPQEMAEWRAVWGGVEEAQRVLRVRLWSARVAYETAAKEALAELTEAMKPWAPVEATLKARSSELAAKLHSHRTVAEQ